ncbi:MAG: lyase HEAT-like repeat protein [Labilithrix sp.]|nr:lyase HEAT-like repeat protein [Labilithrix sp.]
MTPVPIARLVLSPEDRARVERVEELARSGPEGVSSLLELLADPSWAVRRAVVSALAGAGTPGVDGLCDILLTRRDNEARLAAAVDALVASRAEVDARMLALAGDDHPANVICDAVQVLGRRRVRQAVSRIAQLATHEDDNVAVGSIEALGRIGGVETVDPLIGAVELRHFFRTYPAIDALGRTGDVRAVRPLERLLADPLYAPEAIRALGRTGHESAVAPLAALLLRPTSVLVRTAAVALAELRERYEARFGDTETIRRALRQSVEPSAVSQRVIDAMPGVSPSELVAFAGVLGWLGDELSVLQLLELLMEEPPIGAAASSALRRLGPGIAPLLLAAIRQGDSARRSRLLPIIGYAADGIEDIIECLRDPDADVRVRACDALARLGNTAAVSSLFALIGDRDTRVSQAAAAAIQSLGSLETKRLALEQARSTDTRTRRAALRIISYFGYPEGLDILIAAMSDEDEKIREAGIYGLPLVDDPRGTEALLAAAGHEVARTRAAITRALGQTGAHDPAHERVVSTLRVRLSDEDPWTRYYACQALGRLRVSDAAPAIVALIGDPSGQVRVAAVEALAHLRSDVAAAALSEAARSPDADMRRAALVGLGIAGRVESIPQLREAAADEDASTRLVAIGALAELEGLDVVPTLAHAATDPDEAVRGAAIGYLSTRPSAEATSALLDLLEEPVIRDRVIEALAVAADVRVEGVLSALEQAEGERAQILVATLMRMRRASSQAAIGAALGFDNVHARRAAASALAAIGTPEAKEALVRAGSADPDADVRRICATASR